MISVGINSDRNHPTIVMNPKRDAATHAEVAAIRAAGDVDLRGSVLYSARVGRRGYQMMAKPCDACAEAMKKVGIKVVYYTVESREELC